MTAISNILHISVNDGREFIHRGLDLARETTLVITKLFNYLKNNYEVLSTDSQRSTS